LLKLNARQCLPHEGKRQPIAGRRSAMGMLAFGFSIASMQAVAYFSARWARRGGQQTWEL